MAMSKPTNAQVPLSSNLSFPGLSSGQWPPTVLTFTYPASSLAAPHRTSGEMEHLDACDRLARSNASCNEGGEEEAMGEWPTTRTPNAEMLLQDSLDAFRLAVDSSSTQRIKQQRNNARIHQMVGRRLLVGDTSLPDCDRNAPGVEVEQPGEKEKIHEVSEQFKRFQMLNFKEHHHALRGTHLKTQGVSRVFVY